MKKQLLFLVMILLPMVANADDRGGCGDYLSYTFNEESGVLTISLDVLQEGDAHDVISSMWDFMNNVHPSTPWNSYKSSILRVVIEEGVTTIGDYAFWECDNLATLILPNSLETIGNSAFAKCKSLTTLDIPNSVTNIGESSFALCKGLTSLNIPHNVTTIGGSCFSQCENLKSVKLSDNIKVIPGGLFMECINLKSVILPNQLESIRDRAFCGCINLSEIDIPNTVIDIGEVFNTEIQGTNTFYGCKSLTSISIPDGVEIIPPGAFAECSALEDVDLGSGISIISTGAFADCTSLHNFTCKSGTPPWVTNTSGARNTFRNVVLSDVNLFVPLASKELYKSKVPWSGFGRIRTIGAHYLTLGVYGKGKIIYKEQEFEYLSETIDIEPEEDVTVEFIPNEGHSVFQIRVDDTEIMEPPTSYTIGKLEADMKLVAWFSPNWYKLTYMVDDAIYNEQKWLFGSEIETIPAPAKEGYTFSGWSEIPETMPAHDVTVTGTFSINKYTLTYNVDGKEYKSYEVEYGDIISPEAAPTKEGYTFSGWSEIPETMPAHDVTITGTFSINKYKLTYTVDGEVYKNYDVEYGATITPEAEPTKEGYTFSGWSEIPETMPAHDMTVTGSFSINSYKLTYMIDDKVYKETMYEYGATITPEPQPEGDYQTFEWTDLPQTMPAHDVVVYASYTSGIIEVLMASQHNVRIYSPNGKKLNKLQKGLNIVILDDGTVKKVIMK